MTSDLTMRGIYCLIFLIATLPAFSRTLENLPSLPVSPYPDAEVSTNIPLRINPETTQLFDLRVTAICTPSNAFQVAFGCDTNDDGVLSPDETDVIYGWRGGRWFVEDVQDWNRQEVWASADGSIRKLTISFETRSDAKIQKLQITSRGDSLFEALLPIHTGCFFSPNWNLMCVTRRGELIAADNVHLSIQNKGSMLFIR